MYYCIHLLLICSLPLACDWDHALHSADCPLHHGVDKGENKNRQRGKIDKGENKNINDIVALTEYISTLIY